MALCRKKSIDRYFPKLTRMSLSAGVTLRQLVYFVHLATSAVTKTSMQESDTELNLSTHNRKQEKGFLKPCSVQ